MNEQDWADRFSRDVDSLLSTTDESGYGQMTDDYRQMFALARTLSTTDFSGESWVRQVLRRRLLNQIDARAGRRFGREKLVRALSWGHHPALFLVVVVLASLFIVSWTWPGTLTATAQGVENFVQSLRLGYNTSVHRLGSGQAAPLQRQSSPVVEVKQWNNYWVIRTSIGNFGGNVSPGQVAIVHRLLTFGEAQEIVHFRLRQPGYLPKGYTLREVIVSPIGSVFLFYGGPDGDIVLLQTPVGTQSGGDTERVITAAIQTVTDQPIESATLNGEPAAWIEGRGLMWEADSISYTVGGANLSLEEATRIATSLK